jgi:predicted HAD superfamily Cof-like phosphohydrolase
MGDTVNTISKVEEFMKLFNQPVNNNPYDHVDKKLLTLRFRLMLEELIEFGHAAGIQLNMFEEFKKEYAKIEAFCQKHDNTPIDSIAMLDAMVDLRYVADGTILSTGLQHMFDDAFNVVHNSNLSKICNSVEERDRTIQYYKEQNVAIYFKQIEHNDKTKFIIYRESDHKVLKNIDYKQADFTHLYTNNV